MKLNRTQQAILALIIANVIWGIGTPIFKWTLRDIPPFTFAFLRYFFSCLIILPFAVHRLKIKKPDILPIIILSVVGTAFRIVYNFYGLKFVPSINDLILSSTAPVFIIIGAMILFHEKPQKRIINGTLIGLTGIIFIVIRPIIQNGVDFSFVGNIFLLISMGLNVLYVLLLKALAEKYHPCAILFWSFFIAAVTLSPFTGYEIMKQNISGINQLQGMIGLSFTVLFPTITAYLLYIYGIKQIRVSEVGLFSYVDPFVGCAVAAPLLGEQISLTFFIGACMIFLGIFIAEGRIHYHPFHLLKSSNANEQAYAVNVQDSTKV